MIGMPGAAAGMVAGMVMAAGALAITPASAGGATAHSGQRPSGQPEVGTIEARLQTGHGLLRRGLHDLAADEYEAVLASGEADRRTRRRAAYGLGVARYRLGELDAALVALEGVPASGFEFSADALLLRGHAHYRLGRHGEAIEPYRAVVEAHAGHPVAPQAAGMLVETMVLAGAFAGARDAAAAHEALADRGSPAWQRVVLYDAIAAQSMDRLEAAQARYAELLGESPSPPIAAIASLRHAQTLRTLGQTAGARAAFEEAVDLADERTRGPALLGLAGVLRAMGDPAGALDRLNKLDELDALEGMEAERSARARYLRGRALLDTERWREAERELGGLLDSLGVDDGLRRPAAYWHAKAALRDGRPAEAASRLERARRLGGEALEAEMGYDLAVALERAGRTDEAAGAFERFARAHPEHPLAAEAWASVAALRLRAGAPGDAASAARRVVEDFPGSDSAPAASLTLGEALYFAGEIERARGVLEAALAGDRLGEAERAAASFRLGMTLSRLGEHAEAEPRLRQAAGEARFRPALRALGEGALRREDWAEAADWFGRYLDAGEPPADADDARLRLGIALSRDGALEDAVAALERITPEAPDAVRARARFETARALLALGRDGEAEALLDALLAMPGGERFEASALRDLASIATRADQPARAARYLERAAGASDDPAFRAAALLERGRALLAAGEPSEAAGVLDEAEAAAQAGAGNDAEAGALRVVALARSGRPEAAVRVYDRVDLGSVPTDTARLARFEAARALRGLGEGDRAAALLESLRSGDAALDGEAGGPDEIGAFAAFELALLRVERERYERGEALLRELVESRPPAPIAGRAAYQLAWTRRELGDSRGAVAALAGARERGWDLGALWPAAALLEGEALLALDRPRDAAKVLSRVADAREAVDELEAALLRLGEAHAAQQDWAASRAAYERHLREFPESELWFRSWFGAGWALENAGEPERAIERYRRVTERHRGPTAARAQFQIGESLFALGRLEEAAAELLRTDILHAQPEWSAAALYEAGRVFERMNKVGEARAQYREVIERFGGRDWATLARERLEALRAPALPGAGDGGGER